MSLTASKRLMQEYKQLCKNPVEGVVAFPSTDTLMWYYVIKGPEDSDYEGGEYYGCIKFPGEYPFKPPAIRMCTPSGRFEVNASICMSMTEHHPATWNPAWKVSSILVGLMSYMVEETVTLGCVKSSSSERRHFARKSIEYNWRNVQFAKVFGSRFSPHTPIFRHPFRNSTRVSIIHSRPKSASGSSFKKSTIYWVVGFGLIALIFFVNLLILYLNS